MNRFLTLLSYSVLLIVCALILFQVFFIHSVFAQATAPSATPNPDCYEEEEEVIEEEVVIEEPVATDSAEINDHTDRPGHHYKKKKHFRKKHHHFWHKWDWKHDKDDACPEEEVEEPVEPCPEDPAASPEPTVSPTAKPTTKPVSTSNKNNKTTDSSGQGGGEVLGTHTLASTGTTNARLMNVILVLGVLTLVYGIKQYGHKKVVLD